MGHYVPTFVLSVFYISFMCFVQTINLNEAGCEWGTWLPWDCLCCGRHKNFPVYRLRTKCCMNTTNCESFKPCNGSIRFVEDEGFIGKGFCLDDCPHHCNNKSLIISPCVPKVNRTEKITAKEMEASCPNLSKGRLQTNISITNKSFGVLLTFSSPPRNESSHNSTDFMSAWNTHATGNTSLSTNNSYVNCPTTATTTKTAVAATTTTAAATAATTKILLATTTTSTTTTAAATTTKTTRLTTPPYTSGFLNSLQTFEPSVMVTSTFSDNSNNEAEESNKNKSLVGIILGTVSGSLVGIAVLVTVIIILKKKRATTSVTIDQRNKIESCSEDNRTQSA